MVELHQILGVLAIAVNAIAGAIGGLTLWRHVEPRRAYAHLVALGQTTLIGQAAVGLLLLSSGKRSATSSTISTVPLRSAQCSLHGSTRRPSRAPGWSGSPARACLPPRSVFAVT